MQLPEVSYVDKKYSFANIFIGFVYPIIYEIFEQKASATNLGFLFPWLYSEPASVQNSALHFLSAEF